MEVDADVDQHQKQQCQRKRQSTQSRPFSNAERQKRYREKKKADKMNASNTFSQSSDVQPQQEQPQNDVQINKRPLSNAERQRKYRRSLREQKQQQQMEDINTITVLSNTANTSSNDELKNFERCCRLCAEEHEEAVKIFSKEAENMLLKKKLNKYLLIEVEEDDKLPKNICIKCCSKLQLVCEFIDTAIKAQEILHKHSLVIEQTEVLLKSKCIVKEEIESEDDFKYTPIEISVDPLMFLQNSEDAILPHIEENCESGIQIATHLNGIDGEDVTLKLIKKEAETLDPDFDNDTDIKPFCCFTCNQCFCTELALKAHSWIHKEQVKDKPFRCGSCREQFNSKNELVEHLKKHTSSVMCLLPGRRIRTESNSAAHMEAHNSSNNYGHFNDTSSKLISHSVTQSN